MIKVCHFLGGLGVLPALVLCPWLPFCVSELRQVLEVNYTWLEQVVIVYIGLKLENFSHTAPSKLGAICFSLEICLRMKATFPLSFSLMHIYSCRFEFQPKEHTVVQSHIWGKFFVMQQIFELILIVPIKKFCHQNGAFRMQIRTIISLTFLKMLHSVVINQRIFPLDCELGFLMCQILWLAD